MKKYFVVILFLFALLTAGCSGGKNIKEPDKEEVQQDVKEYIQELINEDAEIFHFQISENEEKDGEYTVRCMVSYGTDGEKWIDEFVVQYIQNGNEWELTKCQVQTDNAQNQLAESAQEQKNQQKDPAKREETEKKEERKQEESRAQVQTQASSTTEDTNENTGQEVISLSEDWGDFTFELDGEIYQLPVSYKDFEEHGWRLSARNVDNLDEVTLKPRSFMVDEFELIKGSNVVRVQMQNFTGSKKLLKDCTVVRLLVDYDTCKLDFFIAKGIYLQSSEEEIKEAYGEPEEERETGNSLYLRYQKERMQEMQISLKGKRTIYLINQISPSIVEEAGNDRPEYLDTYVAPEMLETEVESMVFRLDGDLYKLPCPIDAFVDNGWKIVSDSVKQVDAGRDTTDGVEIRKDGIQFSLELHNYSDQIQKTVNCAVCGIHLRDLKDKEPDYLCLSPNIDLENYEEVLKGMSDIFVFKEDSPYSEYRYESEKTEGKFQKTIRYSFNSQGELSWIDIKNCNWDYQK